MELRIIEQVQHLLGMGLSIYSGRHILDQQLKLPARTYPAGIYLPGMDVPDNTVFPLFYGVPLIERTERIGDWLYFVFTNVFYNVCVERVCKLLPAPLDDGGSHIVNRMLTFTRLGGQGCPQEPTVQRALWLAVATTRTPGLVGQAELALQSMAFHLPPQNRQSLYNQCGAVANAAARLLYRRKARN